MMLDRGLLEPVPVRQVPRQSVHIADDHHVELVAFDRPDEVDEVVAADLLERRVPVILQPRHHRPAPPGSMPLGVGQLRWH